GFQTLYTGMDLRGWTTTPEASGHWKANDWTLEHDGKDDGDSGTLWSEALHGDFEMIVDWRYPDDGSGEGAVLLRGAGTRALALPSTGAKAWHRARITLRGNQVSMTVDGVATVTDKVLAGIPPTGRIGLRPAGRPMQWANLFVRRLD
ncbi:MAG: family 16 glycoside hydrolase, partial [Limisphaerales bacterium]